MDIRGYAVLIRITTKQTPESEIEAYLREKVISLGGLCWKFVSPGLIGVPDRIVMLPNGKLFFVELKKLGEEPRPTQLRRMAELEKCKQVAIVIDSFELVDYYINLWQNDCTG